MLIELAVAALVIGIGILALLGLAHVAERAASDAEAETRAALFADEVFTTLRLYSERYAQSTNQQDWIDFWSAVTDSVDPQPLDVAASSLPVWDDSQNNDFPRVVFGNGEDLVAYWRPISGEEIESAAIPDFSMRYRLTIARPGETSSEATSLTTPPLPAMLLATLHVWYGASKVAAEPYTFFTAFSNSGSLP